MKNKTVSRAVLSSCLFAVYALICTTVTGCFLFEENVSESPGEEIGLGADSESKDEVDIAPSGADAAIVADTIEEYGEQQTVSAATGDQSFKFKRGVTVTVPPFLFDGQAQLTVKPTTVAGLSLPKSANALKTYEISLGDVHATDLYVPITFILDTAQLEGRNPSDVIFVARVDEKTNSLIDLPVSISASSVTFYADHLSHFVMFSDLQKKRTDALFDSNQKRLQFDKLQALEKYNIPADRIAGQMADNAWQYLVTLHGFTGAAGTFNEEVLEMSFLKDFNDKMTNLGIAFALFQFVIDVAIKKDWDTASINAFKNSYFTAISVWGTRAMKIACVGIFFIDYSLNKLGSEVTKTREKLWFEVYRKFYDTRGEGYKSWTSWFDDILEIARTSKSTEAASARVKALIDAHIRKIWSEEDAVGAIQASLQNHAFSGGAGLTDALKKKMEAAYRNELIKNLQVVFEAVGRAIEKDAREDYMESYKEILKMLSTRIFIAVHLKGELPKGRIRAKLIRAGAASGKDIVVETRTFRKGERSLEFRMDLEKYFKSGKPNGLEILVESPTSPRSYRKDFKLAQTEVDIDFEIGPEKPALEDSERDVEADAESETEDIDDISGDAGGTMGTKQGRDEAASGGGPAQENVVDENGLKQGLHTKIIKDDAGKIVMKETTHFEDGKAHGVKEEYCRNELGQLHLCFHGRYSKDIPVGVHTKYSDDGKVLWKVLHANDGRKIRRISHEWNPDRSVWGYYVEEFDSEGKSTSHQWSGESVPSI